jgi:hypothetical protein
VAAEAKNPRLKKEMEEMAEVWEGLARECREGIVEKKLDQARSEPEK